MGSSTGFAYYEVEGYFDEVFRTLKPVYGNVLSRIYTHKGQPILAWLLGQRNKFWRTTAEVATAIILHNASYSVMMEVIGFAGGNGLLNIDWGANKLIIGDIEKFLQKHGFKIRRLPLPRLSWSTEQQFSTLEPLRSYPPLE